MYHRHKKIFIILLFSFNCFVFPGEFTSKEVQEALNVLGLSLDRKPEYEELDRFYRLSSNEEEKKYSGYLLEKDEQLPNSIKELQEKEGEVLLKDILWLSQKNDIEGMSSRLPWDDPILDNRFEDGDTPLIYFTRKRQSDVIELLLFHKANFSLMDGNGKTAMIIASENDDEPSMEILARWGAPMPITNLRLNKELSQLLKEHPNGMEDRFKQREESEKKVRRELSKQYKTRNSRHKYIYVESAETKIFNANYARQFRIQSRIRSLISMGARPTDKKLITTVYCKYFSNV